LPNIRDGFWGSSIFVLELYKAAIMAMKFYGAQNVCSSSLFGGGLLEFIGTC
jgi:hypothetical protein